jgi:hypothetical protein
MMRGIETRLRKLEMQSVESPRYFMVWSRAEANRCEQWVKENHPHWPAGSWFIIYDDMTPKEGQDRGAEPPWGWAD